MRKAPAIADITKWLNTPDGAPVSHPSLRGKVVLIDFWTYSCINCQRGIPHVEAWNRAYQGAGLQVIAVHPSQHTGTLTVTLSAGPRAYDLTFG